MSVVTLESYIAHELDSRAAWPHGPSPLDFRAAMAHTTRFAPSPTGRLHLGHALAALVAARAAGPGGRFLLRLEDLDRSRCRPDYEEMLLEDLRWLGLHWEEPVLRQSDRIAAYQLALQQLRAEDLLYPCFCSRREIQEELARMNAAPHHLLEPGGDGPLYPGTCRRLARAAAWQRATRENHALRLDLTAAQSRFPGPMLWQEPTDLPGTAQPGIPAAMEAAATAGEDRPLANLKLLEFHGDPAAFGDAVLARKDGAIAYHLAVVVDDAFQEISLVTRGADLRPATALHRLLQQLLGLPQPLWFHHGLVTDQAGQRLAKRHDSLSLREMREHGKTPEEVLRSLEPFLSTR